MDPMLKRRLHLATLFVLIPLALVVAVFWISIWLSRLVRPLVTLVAAVTNGLRSWNFADSDSHHHMTSMTLAPHQPTTNTATTTLHHWTFTECGIGMVLLVTLLVCVSIIASRSLGKIPIDVTHLYTWKLSQLYNETDDSAPPVSSLPPPLPTTGKAKAKATSPPLQPLEFSTGILSSQEVESPVSSSSDVEISTSTAFGSPSEATSSTMTTPTTKTEGDLSDGTQSEMIQPTGTTTESTTTAIPVERTTSVATTTTTTIDKRRKKRNKQGKKKDRGKRMSTLEQQANEQKQQQQQQQQQQQAISTKLGDSTTGRLPHTQKVSVKTSPQSTILVPPSPPSPRQPPCDDHDSSTSPFTPTPAAGPLAPVVTQEHFSVKPAVSSTSNRSPPSPAVSPNDHHHHHHHHHQPSITPTKAKSTMTASPPLTPTPHQPMVTKFISNKKQPLPTTQVPPPPSTASTTKAFTSFPATPSPPSSSSITTTLPTTTGRQSWYSPFNTGLEFDLLSRSPPSPAHTYISASTSSSPSLSASSSTYNQNDYRLFSDQPSSRPPPPPLPPTIPSIGGGYSNHLQQQQQQQLQSQHIHQLHQYQPHSHSHSHSQSHSSLSLQQYQHRHPTHPLQQHQHQHHHHFQHPPQLYSTGNTYDNLIFGSSTSPIYMESSSSIADLPPPPTTGRLPTPPVSLSPVIAPPPPTLPLSCSSTGEPSSSSSSSLGTFPFSSSSSSLGTFPFSLWYPWKPRSGGGSSGQLPPLHQQQESAYQGNIDEHPHSSFSLFDRKLSFNTGGGGGGSRSHGTS